MGNNPNVDQAPDPPEVVAQEAASRADNIELQSLRGLEPQIEAFLGNPNPPAAMQTAALKATIRVVLYLLRRRA